jgi:hypothetical protein
MTAEITPCGRSPTDGGSDPNMDSDNLIWVDKVLRIIAAIVAILALPLILFDSIMAGDAPGSEDKATHLMTTLLFVDVLAFFTSFLPMPALPLSRWEWVRFGLMRFPSYSVAIFGVGGFLWFFFGRL